MSPANPGSEALSVEDLKAIRERCEGAITAGPWTVGSLDENMVYRNAPPFNDRLIAETENAWDADFIAASRTDVPRLLATIDARDAEIERLSKIEERAKDVAGLPAGTGEYSPTRLRSETAQYILEGDLHTQTTKGDT